jgi:hypothetical protein
LWWPHAPTPRSPQSLTLKWYERGRLARVLLSQSGPATFGSAVTSQQHYTTVCT